MPSWCRALAPLFIVLFVSGARADEARPALPSASLEAAMRAQRSGGVVRSEPIATALLHVAARAPAARRPELLELASQADPALATPYFVRAREALGRADVAGAFDALVSGVRTIPLDARQEAAWLRGAARAVHAWLAAVLATFVVLLAARSARLAAHVFGVRLRSRVAAFVIAGSILASAFAVSAALGILVTAALSVPFWRRRERVTVAVLCGLLATVEIALQSAGPWALLLDPRSDAARAARLVGGLADPELEARWGAAPSRTATQEFLLGLQARQRGDLALAQSRYAACLRQDSTFAPAYVNLANLFFYAGRYDRAAVGYRTAATFAPADPVPRYDLAQAYIRMTNYAEADGEMAAAAMLGMAAAARRQSIWHDDGRPVLDATLSKGEILALAESEWARAPHPALLWTWRSAPWSDLYPEAAISLLLGAMLLLSFGIGKRATSVCSGCKTLVCAHCAALEPADGSCTACSPGRTRPWPREPETEGGSTPRPPRRVSLASGNWVGALFPGAAGLATGAPLGALPAVAVAWAAILGSRALLVAGRAPDAGGWARVDAPALRLALVLVGVVWLAGLVQLRRVGDRKRVTMRTSGAGA